MASIEVIAAAAHQREVLRNLIELYRYDFSQFDDSDVDDDGLYGYKYLECYWSDDDRFPFLARVDGHWAGFALVRSGPPRDMAEFFVMRKYRRAGVGTAFARDVFARFPGAWQVRQMATNRDATTFWRRAIPVAFEQSSNADGPLQLFTIAGE